MMTLGNVKTIASGILGPAGFSAYQIEASQDDIQIEAEFEGKRASVVWPLSTFTPDEVELATRGCAALLKRMIRNGR
jgi:hypothetical protein